MSEFAKTRAAAGYAARHARAELAQARAAALLQRLSACEAAMTAGEAQLPTIAAGMLRNLVLAVSDLAGPAWLEANGDDPDVAAFTVMQATPSPPEPARIDEICSRVLWARFAPAGAGQDGAGGTGPGNPAPSQRSASSIRPAAAITQRIQRIPGQATQPGRGSARHNDPDALKADAHGERMTGRT